MSVENSERRQDKDKKNYLSMLNDKSNDIKDAYYDPKQFRGAKKLEGRSRISLSAVISFLFGVVLIGLTADYFLDGKIKNFIADHLGDNILSINSLEQSSVSVVDDGIKNDKSLSTQIGKCASGYADMQDVKIYIDYTDDLIKILDSGKNTIESKKLTQNEKIATYNKLVIYTLGAVNFHNKKLTKCFSVISRANEVNERSKIIDYKLKEIGLLLK